MKALTFNGKQRIVFESVPDPGVLDDGDVIVGVERTAICGSDLHVYHERERGLDHGTVMGHEFVGVVLETARGVARIKTGDRVMSPFTTSCGSCFYCRHELSSRCERGQLFGWVQEGRGLHGGQAEYVRVPLADSTLVKIPDGVSAEQGLLLGDVMSTGYFCARQAQVKPEGTYVVVGCGPVGLMAIVGARELGAERLFAVDAIPERLEMAARFGATPIHYLEQEPLRIVRDATEGRGADAVMEVVGNESAHRAAYDLVRPGGTISVVGVHNEASFAFNPAEAYDKNLTYRVGRCPARSLIPELIGIVETGKYDLEAVFSHQLRLEEGSSAYGIFDRKEQGCTKIVLSP